MKNGFLIYEWHLEGQAIWDESGRLSEYVESGQVMLTAATLKDRPNVMSDKMWTVWSIKT